MRAISENTTAAVADAAETRTPRYTRADLMQRLRLCRSHFAFLLDLSPAAVKSYESHATHGFLYRPLGVSPVSGRAWFAPWQAELICEVDKGMTLERAKLEFDIRNGRRETGEPFRLPKRGRPRKQEASA